MRIGCIGVLFKNPLYYEYIVWATLLLLVSFDTQAATDIDSANTSGPGVSATEAVLSVNEPMYFVAGGRGDTKARFQFSFKYRILDDDSSLVQSAAWVKGFHFAYTQTALWNLSADSSPFEDSSYRPGMFWDYETRQSGLLPGFVRTGYEHESNGQDGESSRNINTFFFWPFWSGQWHGRDWLIAPKFYTYLSKGSQSQDIADYRGYVDLWLRYGHEDSWLLSAMWRRGASSRNTIQLDLSYPVRRKFLSRTGGYLYLQLFNGYGESLLTYDQRTDTQLRIGFAIVR